MRGPHPSFARRIDRWLQRCGSAFVMEIDSRDGTRYLVGLDAHWQGAQVVAVTGRPGDDDRQVDPCATTSGSGTSLS